MFEPRKIIVSISKNKVNVFKVFLGRRPRTNTIRSFDWTPETLPQALSELKKTAGKKIRILLSEDFAYVVSVSLEAEDKKNERAEVGKKAQELIPEDLTKTIWDFKETLLAPQTDGRQVKIVQVVAVVQTFYEALRKAAAKAGLTIEVIEPVSYSLARLLAESSLPQLIIRLDETVYLIACQRGLVLATESLDVNPTPEHLKEFLGLVKDHYRLEVKNVIVSGVAAGQVVGKLQIEGLAVKAQTLDPAIGLALKQDVRGQDERVLNLTIDELKKQTPAKTQISPPRKRRLFFAGLILLCLAVLTLALFLFSKPQKEKKIETRKKVTAKPNPAQKAEKVATASSILDLQAYGILILNGSGREGEATELKDILEEAGFRVTDTDNAERFDYEETTVKVQKQTNAEFKNALDKILKTVYTKLKYEELASTSEADSIIIIAK